MESARLDEHLSQITTQWTVLFQAHQGTASAVSAAQQQLLQRYSSAVYRYLLACVRDADVADELFQEFALRLVRGSFQGADPEKGRFRQFLKTTLYHLVLDHRRRRGKQPTPLAEDAPEPAVESDPPTEDEGEFLTIWRAELMARVWEALERIEQETGQPLYTVLRLRTNHPELKSPQMAERLTADLGRPVTADQVRKRLFVAREKFTDLLLAEIAASLEGPTAEALAQEVLDLGLMEYCKDALARRSRAS
jgi:RNA polymerase sigma-70 factor (ECF subfamily)